MALLEVPALDNPPWPSLGGQVCQWIEDNLVYGPGDKRGEPYKIEEEFKYQIFRMYEVHPQGSRGAGRRRFNRCGINMRKGLGKTEKGAIIAACELHPDAPVRCDGFDAYGEPVGIGVRDPYVAMVAYTLEQTDELGWNVLRTILLEGKNNVADCMDVQMERIIVFNAQGRPAGKAEPLTGAPNARDGARTTFQDFDETHRMTTPRLMKAHTTMLQNTFKRQMADAWTLEHTTMFDPTEQSVASNTHAYAEEIHKGEIADPRLFYMYRYAPPEMPMDTPEQVREALVEASGPGISWSGDIDGLVAHWFEPKTDQPYYRRVWCNQKWSGAGKAFDSVKWAELVGRLCVDVDGSESRVVGILPPREKIAIGFDGARTFDTTGIIACHLETGYLWKAGIWKRPEKGADAISGGAEDDDWEVPVKEVDQIIRELFSRYKVFRMYGDPYYWTTEMDRWRGLFGNKKVITWDTTEYKKTGLACASFAQAIKAGLLCHDGDADFTEHIGNAVKQVTNFRGDDDVPLWVISKERRGSPLKIDLAMAAVLAFQARNDAIAAGALKRGSGLSYSFN